MFFHAPGKPTNLKKAVYLLASTILGLLLSFLVHALIEINYLKVAADQNIAVAFSNGCALSPWLNISLWVLGAVGGFFLGRFWWRKIYIEKVWAQRFKK
jgi:uncharacterized membrane protein YgaE (UPF0421/DUF939 family)